MVKQSLANFQGITNMGGSRREPPKTMIIQLNYLSNSPMSTLGLASKFSTVPAPNGSSS